MDRFTKISERALCKFKWVFMAISNGCKHQEYLTVMYIEMGFHGSFMNTFTEIPVYIMQIYMGFHGNFLLVLSITNIGVHNMQI